MKTKLTEADYEEIREAYYAGESKEDIAKRKNISKYYVDSIINGQKGVVHHYTNTKREPAGRITFEMIAEIRNNLRIGDRLLITLIEEKKWLYKKTYPKMPGDRKIQTCFYCTARAVCNVL